MTRIMCHVFHACDSFEQMTWFGGYEWLRICGAVTHTSHLMDFALGLIMSYRGYVTRGDESTGLGLWDDGYIRCLVPTKREVRPSGTLLLTFLAGIPSARWLRSPLSPPTLVRPFLGYT